MSDMAKQELKYKKQTKVAQTQTENDEAKAKKQQPAADQLTKAFIPAQKSSDILKVVSSLLPADTWLTGVTFERGKPILIRGTSKSPTLVSNFVSGLTKQKRFRDVRLMYANGGDIQGIPTVQFSINAFPVGNLPILETGKKKK
jgi:Tfp pilus assembly protein PilN